MRSPFKARLAAGEPLFGSFVFLPSPDVVEIMGIAGFDYVIIDLEHSPKNWETVGNMVRAAELHAMTPLIRVKENSDKQILEALELGAKGIVLPYVQSAAELTQAARAIRYAPEGTRGTCTLTRAARYGSLRSEFADHTRRMNNEIVLIALIEDMIGATAVPEMLECSPGADCFLVGRSDMAASLGHPGQAEHPAVLAATDRIVKSVVAHPSSAQVGMGLYAPEEASRWLDNGCRVLFYSADTALMLRAATQATEAFKAGAAAAHHVRAA